MRFINALIGIFIATAMPALAQERVGPSFNCATGRDTIARMICSDAQMSRLDLAFVQAYQALRQQVGEAGQKELRQQAVEFQNGVYERCNLPKNPTGTIPLPSYGMTCIGQFYLAQRAQWLARLSPPAREEATRSAEEHIRLQQDLQAVGFLPVSAIPDGVYGTTTRTGIAAWQKSRSLLENGFLSEADAFLLRQAAVEARAAASVALARQQQEETRRKEADLAAAREREVAAARLREETDRVAALTELNSGLGAAPDTAVVLVALGRDGGRIRKNLRGEFSRIDPAVPPLMCAIAAAGASPKFTIYALHRVLGGLVREDAPAPQACTGDMADRADVIFGFGVERSLVDRRAAQTIAQTLKAKTYEMAGGVPLADWQAVLDTQKRIAEAERDRQRSLAEAIRTEAASGSFVDWAAAVLPGRDGASACIVGPVLADWARLLRSNLPQPFSSSLRQVSADLDPDTALGRLLKGDCTMIVAKGGDFGDLLRGIGANHRDADVVAMRLEPASVEASMSRPAQAAAESSANGKTSQILVKTDAEQPKSEGSAEQNTERLRRENGPRATALVEELKSGLTPLVSHPQDATNWAARTFPNLTRFFGRQDAEGWVVSEFAPSLVDYGLSQYQGRSIETLIVNLIFRQKNANLGRYENFCFVVGYQNDTEFRRIRDAFETPCNAGSSAIATWKGAHEFESRWASAATVPTAGISDAPPKGLAGEPDQLLPKQVEPGAPKPQPRVALPIRSALTPAELDQIRKMVSECWNPPAGTKDLGGVVVEIRIAANPDGSIGQASIVDSARLGTDLFFRQMAESALRAVHNPRCTPLPFPPEKYEIWKTFTLSFNSRDLF